MSSVWQPTLVATTDANGAATFTADPPLGSGLWVQVMISILGTNGAGDFYAQIANGKKWGGWSGSAPFGPVTYQGNQKLSIVATGLTPATTYTCELYGIVGDQDELGSPLPSATSSPKVTGLGSTSSAVNQNNIAIGATSTQIFGPFPVGTFPGVQVAAHISGGGPVRVLLQWTQSDDPSAFRPQGYRAYIIGDRLTPTQAGIDLQVYTPNLGDTLTVFVQSLYLAATVSLAVDLTTSPVGTYSTAKQPSAVQSPSGQMALLDVSQYQLTGLNAVTFQLPQVVQGPHVLDFSPWDLTNKVNMQDWELYIKQYSDAPAAYPATLTVPLVTRTSAGDGNGRHTGLVFMPPRTTLVQVKNNDAVTRVFDLTLAMDRDRVG